ncbi:hypothetical protein [Caulobacter sp.]|uniref:hypothetical protein n=1 Tax=Caulobacter sp. TaxID=78 RepID=UPI0031D62F29
MKPLLLAGLAAGVLACGPAVAEPLLTLRVKPTDLDVPHGKAVLDVSLTLAGAAIPAGAPVLVHTKSGPAVRLPFQVLDLAASDDRGALALVSKDGGRTYVADRDVVGTLKASYRRPIDAAAGGSISTIPTVDGPGVSGIANMLFALPSAASAYHVKLDWDLSAFPAGSEVLTSLGDGEHLDIPSVSAERLSFTMLMVGKIQREPNPATGAFTAVWTGQPSFDLRGAMRWAGKLHGHMSQFFQDDRKLPYHVFVRAHARTTGTAVPMAFTLGYNTETTPENVEHLLGHEMTHTWTANDLDKWYTEGNAVYYQTLLPWRFGMMSAQQRLEDLNQTAARYYTNDMIGRPDSEILPKFWSDVRYNVLPYDRGAIYFAVLNGKVLRASRGKRSVDDLIRRMVLLARDGQTLTEQTWIGLLQKELGEEGPAIHKAMMSGQTLVPDSDAYGPCFRRVAVKIPRFDVGFGPPGVNPPAVVADLRADSNAAKAGLKDGDKLQYLPGSTAAQRDPKALEHVRVTRGDQTFEVSFLPRGELRDAYQWERTAVPESACK